MLHYIIAQLVYSYRCVTRHLNNSPAFCRVQIVMFTMSGEGLTKRLRKQTFKSFLRQVSPEYNYTRSCSAQIHLSKEKLLVIKGFNL